jgi:polyhydroxyalkanoate synthesis regulator phasin
VTQLDGIKRYIEAATTLTSITRARAEELVRDLVASGELERGRAQDWIEDLVRRSREASEALVSTVSSEVDRQLGERGLKNFDLDDLAQRVAAIITMAGNAGRNATSARSHRDGQADGAATKKTSASKSSASKSSAKSSGKSSTKASAKKKDGDRDSGTKSSSKNPKGSSSKKSESKKVTTLTAADETAGTAT